MHRYRVAFIGGFAVGFVAGARAGRERYEQLKKLARKAADSPAVQQAAGAVQAQATDVLKSAGHRVAAEVHQRVPKMADSARHKVTERIPGRRAADPGVRNSDANGHGAVTGRRPFAEASGVDTP